MINNALLISFWKRKKNKASPRTLAAPAPRALLLTSRAVLPRPSPRLSPLAASTPSPSPARLSLQAQLDRVTKLQEVARAEKEKRKTQALGPGMESFSPAPGPAVGPSAHPRGRPPQSACKATYDAAHAALPRARVLVLDTETSGLAGCVLDLGWVLADSDGKELAAYSKLWLLPPGERIHSGAFRAHGISGAEVQRDGVAPTPELQEFASLVAAALAAGK